MQDVLFEPLALTQVLAQTRIRVRAGRRLVISASALFVTQTLLAAHATPSARRFTSTAARFSRPSWLISIVVHAALVGVLASLSWTVSRQAPDGITSLAIVIRKGSADGPVSEYQEPVGSAPGQGGRDTNEFLPQRTPPDLVQALPPPAPVDASTIAIFSSMVTGTGGLLAVPDTDDPAGAGMLASTQFFGEPVWGSKFVYVIDRSGSMAQRDALGAAKRELIASLAKLPAAAQFQIIFYNVRPDIMRSGEPTAEWVFATEPNKVRAQSYLETITADGGTDHVPALKLALGLGSDVVFFLTDADDMNAREVKELTEFNKGRTSIHVIEFGIGADLDSETALHDLATMNGGSYRYIDVTSLPRAAPEDKR